MGLSSFKFVQWAPKDAYFLRQSAFWPFKVIRGHPRSMILVPIKARVWLPIVINIVTLVLSCTVSEIYGDLLAKNCLFFLPLSHLAPSLPRFPSEFRAEVNKQMRNGPMGLSYSEDLMIVAWVVLTQCQRVTDGQTDRRTDGRTDGRIYDS